MVHRFGHACPVPESYLNRRKHEVTITCDMLQFWLRNEHLGQVLRNNALLPEGRRSALSTTRRRPRGGTFLPSRFIFAAPSARRTMRHLAVTSDASRVAPSPTLHRSVAWTLLAPLPWLPSATGFRKRKFDGIIASELPLRRSYAWCIAVVRSNIDEYRQYSV